MRTSRVQIVGGVAIMAVACSSQVSDVAPAVHHGQALTISSTACGTPSPEARSSVALDSALALSKPSTSSTKKKSMTKSDGSRSGAAIPPNRMIEAERLRRATYLAELVKLKASMSGASDLTTINAAAATLKAKIVGE